ncbi:MAG: hypothetical protein DM484_00335, partial [Candidatus Methylumidiphilus alinenensis]
QAVCVFRAVHNRSGGDDPDTVALATGRICSSRALDLPRPLQKQNANADDTEASAVLENRKLRRV